ncbi:MAG: Gfo/Idh/MocA family oxidoreductase [Phycisphaerales bacterium]|nr:Gfo/Idh/MocA family oxidoreductase [Phycisphaerales bacterium]
MTSSHGVTFGLGLIGCGGIANVHAQAARRAGIKVVGGWDVLPERAQVLTKEHGGVASASIDELLAMKSVDAVVVAVPNDRHCECACAALKAGKHVLLEKPMALSRGQCDEILAVAQTSSGSLQMGFVCRQSPTALAAKKWIDSGRFGEIYHIKASLYRRRGIPGLGGWFTTKCHSGGGPLIDLGVHLIDLSLHLAGHPKVERVSGMTWSKFGSPIADYRFTSMWAGPPQLGGTFDVEDAATALIRCAGGLTIELNVTWAANIPDGSTRDGIAIWGSRAGAYFDVLGKDLAIATEEEGMLVDLKPQFDATNPLDQAWDEQYRHFAQLVTQRKTPVATGGQGRSLQCVIDAIYESSRMNREVEVA